MENAKRPGCDEEFADCQKLALRGMVKLQRTAGRRECGVYTNLANGVVFIPVTVFAVFFLRAVLPCVDTDAGMWRPLVILRESNNLLDGWLIQPNLLRFAPKKIVENINSYY
jgi:hypothetical protein